MKLTTEDLKQIGTLPYYELGDTDYIVFVPFFQVWTRRSTSANVLYTGKSLEDCVDWVDSQSENGGK